MEQISKERRRTSYNGLLDAAIRGVGKLSSSHDPATRLLANQVLNNLTQLRRELPARRQFDTLPPRKAS